MGMAEFNSFDFTLPKPSEKAAMPFHNYDDNFLEYENKRACGAQESPPRGFLYSPKKDFTSAPRISRKRRLSYEPSSRDFLSLGSATAINCLAETTTNPTLPN